MAYVSAGHYLVGIEGLAILRTWLTAPGDEVARRMEELARLVTHPDQPPLAIAFDVPEETVQSGYARWASSYESAPNPLIRAEEPVLHALIDAVPPGRALDAACGTGRHTKYLVARGHSVMGVDASTAMLERARAAVPQVDFRLGDLLALPLATGSVDLVVCALALSHCQEIAPPIRELARVLRSGGRLLLSDLHPLHAALGMTAFFVAADGSGAGQVRSYHHTHAAYLDAFREAGLEVGRCFEPPCDDTGVAMLSGGMMDLAPEAFRQAFLGLPAVLVWELMRR